MNKSRVVWGIALVAALSLLALPKMFSAKKTPMASAVAPAPLSVNAVVLKPRVLENKVYATGTLLANEEVDLRSEIAGKVSKIFFQEGASVGRNQLLLKLNDDELQAQKKRVESQLRLAELREARQRELLAQKAASQEEYDVALNELHSLKAQLDALKAQIDRTEIRAPFAGKIGLRYVSEGSYVSPATRIATLQNSTPIKLDFSIPEKYASQARVGDKVFFRVQSSPKTFEAKVYAIEPRIDLNTRTLQLRAIHPNKDGELIAGAFADVELVLQEIKDALMVPTEALVPELKSQKVFVIRNGKVAEQTVTVGLRTEKEALVTSGLKAGDTVLTTGVLQARSGMTVSLNLVEQ
ncbi:MAG: efflux RND transporter periplasmic adaptor subunit [Chloroherpetonaceae bacterium]|nr:efflux RND transporter periplasmic adaptor subunit [Chloroherpetonaceae bacterium]